MLTRPRTAAVKAGRALTGSPRPSHVLRSTGYAVLAKPLDDVVHCVVERKRLRLTTRDFVTCTQRFQKSTNEVLCNFSGRGPFT